MSSIDQPFYNLPDVSRKLGNVSRSTLYRLIEQRKLIRVNIGSKAVITGKSLAEYTEGLMAAESNRQNALVNKKNAALAKAASRELYRAAKAARPVSPPSEYRCWNGIKQRCFNSNDKYFENYGGRGIKVCNRWLESYENFLADMGRKPSASHSIDRINNDGDYEPSNCRWATPKQQAANRRQRRWQKAPVECE